MREAAATVAGLLDRIGYDPVRLESLRAGRVLQPGGPVFGVVLTLPEFERAVRADARSLTGHLTDIQSGPFRAWIGVGGNPQSVIRAAYLGFSLALAIIGGPPAGSPRTHSCSSG